MDNVPSNLLLISHCCSSYPCVCVCVWV